MKSKLKLNVILSLLCIICLMFAGCPYSSEVPLDSIPQNEISPNLLGTWKAKRADDSTWVKFEMKSKNEYTITANLHDMDSEGYEINYFTGYLSIFADHSVLNVKQINGEYYFVVAGTHEGRLYLKPFSDNISLKFNSSEEAKEFFTKELSKSEGEINYDDFESLIDMIKAD